MGTFQYEIEIGDATGQRFERVNCWVDSGALYSQFPASMLRRLGHEPNATRRFKLADGSVTESPIGPVPMRLNGEIQPVICLYAEEDSDPLLGAMTMEAFSVAPEVVSKTLRPIIAMRLTRLPAAEDAP